VNLVDVEAQCLEDHIKYPLPRHLPFAYTPPHFEIQTSDVIYAYSFNSESPNPDYKCVREESGNSVCDRNNHLKIDKLAFDNLTAIKENLKVFENHFVSANFITSSHTDAIT
jgi:hypothetical protein